MTGESNLKFDDKKMNLKNDIKAIFDQVMGLDTDSGKMFPLYNALFKRLPDPDGLRYWIGNLILAKMMKEEYPHYIEPPQNSRSVWRRRLQ